MQLTPEQLEQLEKCKSKRTLCEIWTRVMGYIRPKSEYNKGKKQEFADRKCFEEPEVFKDGK